MNSLEDGLRALEILVDSGGGSLEPVRHLLCQRSTEEIASANFTDFAKVRDMVIRGFFHCAARNTIFTDLGAVQGYYGRSLSAVYSGCSPTFMKLARTYWTFKVLLIQCRGGQSVCLDLLRSIDETFAGVFFPTPGPFSPPKEQREAMMRTLIAESGADFDVEDYIRGNYYLT